MAEPVRPLAGLFGRDMGSFAEKPGSFVEM